MRLFHYRIGMLSALFLVTSALTGLLWAYAPYLYWQPGYMEKKSPAAAALSEVQLELRDIMQLLRDKNKDPARLEAITLRSEAGLPVYEASLERPAERLLIDGVTGAVLSPLDAELAVRFSRQYVLGAPRVAAASLEQPWIDRKGKSHAAAWRIAFADPAATEVVLDARTGKLLEDSDSVRRFHFWVMNLHQFNFFGTHKVLSAASGVPLLILSITGLILGWQRLRFSKRRRHQLAVPLEKRAAAAATRSI